jgi:hypothetical protein
MKDRWYCASIRAGLLAASLALCGCASISVSTKAYLGSPNYAPSEPARVQILASEPKVPKDRLGEVRLSVAESPPREKLEEKLRQAAAKLGADAVFVVHDKTYVFPLVYVGWGGPGALSEETRREIVAVAIKYK